MTIAVSVSRKSRVVIRSIRATAPEIRLLASFYSLTPSRGSTGQGKGPPHSNNMIQNQNHNQYTVAVHPIQQSPGQWFATYIVSRYESGRERVLENVAVRDTLHRTEALAKQVARQAGERAITRLRRH
ncbi:hypothetical protein [Cupriavidus gilardii]|uniref:hypothetical protein n=1 Tax=Cupriavidus gilardii TaxID=82541 RepID=UPI00326628B6